MRRHQQIVGTLTVLQAEQRVTVLGPAASLLIGLARQQSRKMHLLRPCRRHLFADDVFDLAAHPQAERQPREQARPLPPNVPGAQQQPMAGDFRIGRVVTEGADKEVGEACDYNSRFYRQPS